MAAMIRLTSLWENVSEKGEKYYRGRLSPSLDFIVLTNKQKTIPNHPDYIAYIKVKQKDKESILGPYTGLWKHDSCLQGKTKDGALLQIHKNPKAKEGTPGYAAYIVSSQKTTTDFD